MTHMVAIVTVSRNQTASPGAVVAVLPQLQRLCAEIQLDEKFPRSQRRRGRVADGRCVGKLRRIVAAEAERGHEASIDSATAN